MTRCCRSYMRKRICLLESGVDVGENFKKGERKRHCNTRQVRKTERNVVRYKEKPRKTISGKTRRSHKKKRVLQLWTPGSFSVTVPVAREEERIFGSRLQGLRARRAKS